MLYTIFLSTGRCGTTKPTQRPGSQDQVVSGGRQLPGVHGATSLAKVEVKPGAHGHFLCLGFKIILDLWNSYKDGCCVYILDVT